MLEWLNKHTLVRDAQASHVLRLKQRAVPQPYEAIEEQQQPPQQMIMTCLLEQTDWQG